MDVTQIIVAIVGGVAVTSAAAIPAFFSYKAHRAMNKVSESVGKSNGHGSIQDQLDVMWQIEQLDKHERELGRKRQSRIEEVQADLAEDVKKIISSLEKHEELMKTTSEQLVKHAEEDTSMFSDLRAANEDLNGALSKLIRMVGSPVDWDRDGITLVEYLRNWHHDEINKETKAVMLDSVQRALLERAIDAINRYDGHLDDLNIADDGDDGEGEDEEQPHNVN